MNREEMTVDLGEAGWLTLSFEVDVWSISESDAAWLLGLVRTMRELIKRHAPDVETMSPVAASSPVHLIEEGKQ